MIKAVNDPLEPINRASFAINESLFKHVFYPVSEGYNWLVPEKVRLGISNFHEKS
ncbi:MAG: VacJ family lipoprotein [Lentisphaeraceae bacterium]|nr:VacJ family lipoprotein [Lentisphaeraceae bacterium]